MIMEDNITWVHVITWIVQGLTIFAVFASWYFVPLFTERKRKEAEVGMWQHTAMSDAHRNLATTFYELEQYWNELGSKYNCKGDDVKCKMIDEELNKANGFLQQINTELAIMYMVMPDNKYKVVRDAIDPWETKLDKQREKLLAAMRKSQFPDTTFYQAEHIRLFHPFKRPQKEVKTQQ